MVCRIMIRVTLIMSAYFPRYCEQNILSLAIFSVILEHIHRYGTIPTAQAIQKAKPCCAKADHRTCLINHQSTKLNNLNFHPLEVVSRYRDRQL